MLKRNIENVLALVAAVVVLVGVSFAARNAFAEGPTTTGTTAVAIHTATNASVERAETAQTEAAAEAADAVRVDARLDLDIGLAGRKLVASGD